MPYCSIQEAWGTDFYGDKNQPKRFKKIVPEFARDVNIAYNNVNYPETDVYDSNGSSIYIDRKPKEVRRRKSFSRTYNRLPEHSGPNTRLPKPINEEDLVYSETKYLVDSEDRPTDSNMDLPINEYDLELEEKLNDKKTKEQFTNNNSSYINNILKENIELRKIIENFNNKNQENDNIFDLILFISAGVFIIFLLDIVSKGIRRF